MDSYRINRKNAISLGSAIQEFLKDSRLSSGLNNRLIFSAWDKASGAAPFTLKRFCRDGKLYITLSSSVVRSSLSAQKGLLVEKMNAILSQEDCFTRDDPHASWIKELILK